MKSRPSEAEPFGIPGAVTETALTLRPGLSMKEWADTLRLLGRLAGGVSWWLADALLYGEERYGEQYAQDVHECGLAPQTISNMMWVARSVPRSRRREALSWKHHAEVAALEPEDQEHWLSLAESGEILPNGEQRPWSASHLRQQLRALAPGKASSRPQEATSAAPMPAPVRPEKSPPGPSPARSAAETTPATGPAAAEFPPAGKSERQDSDSPGASGVPVPVVSVGSVIQLETYGPCQVTVIYGSDSLPRILEPQDVLIQCRRLAAVVVARKPAKAAKPVERAPRIKDWATAPWPSPEALAHLYNTETPDNVPAVETLSAKRREAALRALRQFPERAWWVEVCEEYRRSRFLSGKSKPGPGHESFRPSFDWLMANGKDRVENAVKVHDGSYR